MSILVIDDERNIRKSIDITLRSFSYKCFCASNLTEANEFLLKESIDIILLDICLEEENGIEYFDFLKKNYSDIIVIFISGNATLQDAVKTVQNGAYDFLEKPFSSEKLITTIKRSFDYLKITKELNRIKKGKNKLIGKSPKFLKLLKSIEKVAKVSSTVLVTGESGTGKELVARMIHNLSQRSENNFVMVNCSAIPETLIESSLFGHKKGSFTGAINDKKGFFEQAHLGTIFLDEVADLSLSAQAKVLRALQEKEIQKVGDENFKKVDVRIIAATHKNIPKLIEKGEFREDLYYRLNVLPLQTISVRDNLEDLPVLIDHFLSVISLEFNQKKIEFTKDALNSLLSYSWPGNIRELKNILERIAIMSDGVISLEDLPLEVCQKKVSVDYNKIISFKEFKKRSEKDYFLRVLNYTNWNISKAASLLEIERTYLHKKMKIYTLTRPD